MLAMNDIYFFLLKHKLYHLISIFLLCLILSGCFYTQNSMLLQSKSLGKWQFTDAQYSTQGLLAVTLQQQAALYNEDYQLTHLVHLPEPDGIWQIVWVTTSELIIYDRYHIFVWDYSQEQLQTAMFSLSKPIRQLTATPQGLLLGTPSGHVVWYPRSQWFQHQAQGVVVYQHELQEPVSVGFTQTNKPYIGTHHGKLWIWEDTQFQQVTFVQLEHPVIWVDELQEHYYAFTREYTNPLVQSPRQTLWQFSSTAHHAQKENIEPLAFSIPYPLYVSRLLATDNAVFLSGSRSQWLSWDPQSTQFSSLQSPNVKKKKNPLTLAIYARSHSLDMINSDAIIYMWDVDAQQKSAFDR